MFYLILEIWSPTDGRNYNDTFFSTGILLGMILGFTRRLIFYSWINGDLKYIGIVKNSRLGLRKEKLISQTVSLNYPENYFRWDNQ